MHDQAQSTTKQLIAALWLRNQAQVLERLDLLQHAAAAAGSGELTPDLQRQAAAVAHKLAGSLGMFGFQEGTRIARELEQHLDAPKVDPSVLASLSAELRQSLFPAA
jgi:HPt (histidine-containing phosphotransfer) domain-containing protein